MIRTMPLPEKPADPITASERAPQDTEKTTVPLTQGLSVEIQTYLPSLYLKKYRLIERLNGLRYGFPTMENPETNANQPIVRSLTAWDKVLQDVATKVRSMREVKKYRIAEKAFFARKCQRKYKRSQLKKQQIYCFQRCLSSKLAQRVMQKFREFSIKQQQLIMNNQPNKPLASNNSNDVFINEDDIGYDMPFIPNANILDLFDDNNVQPMVQQVVPKETIENYMKSIVIDHGLGEEVKIKRSQFLSQIKESMRKRFKYKEKNNSTNVPRTGGAQLLLNNLIKVEVGNEETMSSVPSAPQALTRNMSSVSVNQQQKKRKRKQDQFLLNWNDDQFEQMKSMNEFIDRKASKIQNLNDLLSLYVVQDLKSENYSKVFQKTIQKVREFPQTLSEVKKPEEESNTRYADPCYDYQSQHLMASEQYNIESLVDHFIQVSPYLFSEQLDLSNRNYKIQVDPKNLFTVGSIKQKDAILFKFDKGLVQIVDQKYFSRETTSFGKLIKHTQLFFLIEYYLSKFGNQWGLITQCIRTNPLVRNMCLTSDQIQNLHSFYNMKRGKNISFSDKVILPFKDEFEEVDTSKQTKQQTFTDINQDNYQSFIRSQVQQQEQESKIQDNNKTYLGNKFSSFIKRSQGLGINTNSNTFLDSVRDNMNNYFQNMVYNIKTVGNSDVSNQIRAQKDVKIVQFQPKENPKAPRVSNAFKRRKIINQKTSPLVGVLSKKKPNMYIQYQRPEYPIKRQQSATVNSIVVPPPPVVKNESLMSGKQTTKQTFPTNKVEDKQKTPTKKPPPAASDAKNSGQKQRRRKPDPKP